MLHQYSASGIEPICSSVTFGSTGVATWRETQHQFSWSEGSSSFAKKFSTQTKIPRLREEGSEKELPPSVRAVLCHGPAVSTHSSRLMTAGMARLGSAAFIVDFTALTS